MAFLAVSSASARPGGWGHPGWDGEPRPGYGDATRHDPDRSREGHIEVNRFVADEPAAKALGHGPIVVTSHSGGSGYVDESDRAVFEAAVVDRLVHAGYDTAQANPQGGQIAELRIASRVIEPAEARRKPVSGEAAMEIGNRGTAYGLALNVDLTKPLPPLISTRLETRIVDRTSGKVLWEGRANVATREGDEKWTRQEIASRLAEALFDGFPHATETVAPPD